MQDPVLQAAQELQMKAMMLVSGAAPMTQLRTTKVQCELHCVHADRPAL